MLRAILVGGTKGSRGDCTMTHRDSEVSTLLRAARSVLALAVLPALAVATAGCGNSGPPPEDTYVNAVLKPSLDAMNNNLCNTSSAMTALLIGVQGATDMDSPTTVQDGSQGVDITCTVRAGFTVSLLALSTAGASGGGSISIGGNVASTSTGTNISAQLSGIAGDGFSEDDCTLAATYENGTIPTMPFIAPGRIWSHLSCPNMASTMGKSKVINGTTVTEACDVEADFLFENCSQ
jgi:hypothetical protein